MTKPLLPIHDPRAAALNVLNRQDKGNKTLDTVLDDVAPSIDGMARRDRALFNQLVYGVLRWRLRLDAVVDAYANRPLKKIAPPILNVLRIGLFQILFMDRIPASAAVNTAVNLVRTQRATKAAGFVNALLRAVLRDPKRFSLPDADDSPVNYITTAKSIPHWLASRWINRMGLGETERLCDAMNTIPPITLRCNELKNNLPDLVHALAKQAEYIETNENVPGMVTLVRPRCPIAKMSAFVDGRFAVQDGAAQLVSLLLAPRPGETVLDACAGLGGKSTHMAQLMKNQGRIVAMDTVFDKLVRLEKESHRLGATIIDIQRANLNRPLTVRGRPRFDRILVDAPCSGLGVIRRNPDAKWSSLKKDIARFAERQTRFLDHLAPLVKIGGIVVFAVCSMEPEENEQVVKSFLKKHANFAITGQRSAAETIVGPYVDESGFFRTIPHVHHMDGFFAVRLKRIG